MWERGTVHWHYKCNGNLLTDKGFVSLRALQKVFHTRTPFSKALHGLDVHLLPSIGWEWWWFAQHTGLFCILCRANCHRYKEIQLFCIEFSIQFTVSVNSKSDCQTIRHVSIFWSEMCLIFPLAIWYTSLIPKIYFPFIFTRGDSVPIYENLQNDLALWNFFLQIYFNVIFKLFLFTPQSSKVCTTFNTKRKGGRIYFTVSICWSESLQGPHWAAFVKKHFSLGSRNYELR